MSIPSRRNQRQGKGRRYREVEAIEPHNKKLIADEYRRLGSYAETARAVGWSKTTVRNIVMEEKRQREYLSAMPAIDGVDGYIRAKQGVVIGIINKCLAILSDDEKLQSATLPQIASAMTTLLEKFTLDEEKEASQKPDPLTKSLMEMAEKLTTDYEKSLSQTTQDDGKEGDA